MTADLNTIRVRRYLDTVRVMIQMYCDGHHPNTAAIHHRKGELCPECEGLWNYARKRVLMCPFGDARPACSKCPKHCYAPKMRNQIKVVMKYSGPRMALRHPIMAVLHLIDTRRSPLIEKRRSA